jgi:hypothetical protein
MDVEITLKADGKEHRIVVDPRTTPGHSRWLTGATESSFCAASRQHPTPVELAQIGGSGSLCSGGV